jgi:translation initiation factor 4E
LLPNGKQQRQPLDKAFQVSFSLQCRRNETNEAHPNSASSKLSLSTNDHESKGDPPSRSLSSKHSAHSRNPLNAFSPLGASGVSSPNSAASSQFGLGTGAFAAFGSASKTPKTPGAAFDFSKAGTMNAGSGNEKKEKADSKATANDQAVAANKQSTAEITSTIEPTNTNASVHRLKYSWMVWYRPPTSKNSDYEKSIKPLCHMSTVEEFWKVYVHLKRPSTLPTVSDYHFFRSGIRPLWEDNQNKKGGKLIMRIKKVVSDRIWEDLLMSLVGDMYEGAGDEICGAVISVRSGEDVISIWTKSDSGKNVRIR